MEALFDRQLLLFLCSIDARFKVSEEDKTEHLNPLYSKVDHCPAKRDAIDGRYTLG